MLVDARVHPDVSRNKDDERNYIEPPLTMTARHLFFPFVFVATLARGFLLVREGPSTICTSSSSSGLRLEELAAAVKSKASTSIGSEAVDTDSRLSGCPTVVLVAGLCRREPDEVEPDMRTAPDLLESAGEPLRDAPGYWPATPVAAAPVCASSCSAPNLDWADSSTSGTRASRQSLANTLSPDRSSWNVLSTASTR